MDAGYISQLASFERNATLEAWMGKSAERKRERETESQALVVFSRVQEKR